MPTLSCCCAALLCTVAPRSSEGVPSERFSERWGRCTQNSLQVVEIASTYEQFSPYEVLREIQERHKVYASEEPWSIRHPPVARPVGISSISERTMWLICHEAGLASKTPPCGFFSQRSVSRADWTSETSHLCLADARKRPGSS